MVNKNFIQLPPAEIALYVSTITLFMYEFSAQISLRSCLRSLTFAITINAQRDTGCQKERHFTLGKKFYQEST